MELSDPISNLNMIGPTYAKRLNKLNIHSIEDLLHHYPLRHQDFSIISPINKIQAGETITIQGTIISIQNLSTHRGLQIQKATIADNTGQIQATWFNQPFITNTLQPHAQVSLSGIAKFFNSQLTLTSPQYEIISQSSLKHTGKLIPIYPQTYGLSSKWLRSRIAPLLEFKNFIQDWLPTKIKTSNQLLPLQTAIKQIHFPKNHSSLKTAQNRLKFDELFLLQIASQKRKYLWQNKHASHTLIINQEKIAQLISSLSFTLTKDQNISLKQILTDISKQKPMNRLLQGDVGSGKTVIAAITIYATHLNNLKSILMAPTQILAQQHFDTLKTVFANTNIKIKLVTSSTQKLSIIKSKSNVFVGTHALLFRKIPKNLGLLIIDEQHRFGVQQRSKLLKNPKTPHLLSMTATPIPRSIALTALAELDISIIKQMPKGRKKIKTWLVPKSKRAAAHLWIDKQINKHKTQAFIVCPLIEDSEFDALSQVKAVQTHFKYLKTEIFPHLKLDLLHGRLNFKQKTKVLNKFKKGQVDILVTTPIIEVGIDIPQASIILIEAAERFGLAQLHQLRGRVGRGNQKSYCLLFTTNQEAQTLKRLKALETLSSGFDLSELDLKLRGPGELHGIAQHGFARLKIASFADTTLIKKTHRAATQIIKKDPQLKKYPLLSQKLSILLHPKIHPN